MSAGFRKERPAPPRRAPTGVQRRWARHPFFVSGRFSGRPDPRPGGDRINVPKKPAIRVNDRIRIPQVRVIDEEGNQLGIMSNLEALNLAQERMLDLVEISPTARPPVCKIMDFGKFKYEENKQARKARKHQHVMLVKEIKLRPKIDDHDYEFKVNHARTFLSHKDKVKFTVTFRGREMVHMEYGRRILEGVVKDLADIGVVEIPARVEGRTMTLYMIPKKEAAGPAPSRSPAPEAPKKP